MNGVQRKGVAYFNLVHLHFLAGTEENSEDPRCASPRFRTLGFLSTNYGWYPLNNGVRSEMC